MLASVGITVSNAVVQAAIGVWPYPENRMPGFLNACAPFTLPPFA